MQVSGELINNTIIISKSKDIGRLYNKSNFGKINSENKLQLDLLEGMFLLSENKIKIHYKKKQIDFEKLVKKASENISRFEEKFLVFRDLRKRGYNVKLNELNEGFDFHIYNQINVIKNNKICFISAFSERYIIEIKEIMHLINIGIRKNGNLWIAIVDEEGDITYYEVTNLDIKGKTIKNKFPKGKGILFENRVLIFDKRLSGKLLDKEFFGKPFGDSLQLSMVESLYLIMEKIVDIYDKKGKKISFKKFENIIKNYQEDIKLRFNVFHDLKKRGLIIKTGFKFGAHFRVYTKKPDESHAEFLVHVVDKKFKKMWTEISRAVRLAHSVNKEIIYAVVNKNDIEYIKFGRLRP